MLAYGAYRPDVLGVNTGYCSVADNVLPGTTTDGKGNTLIAYGPFHNMVVPTGATALSGAPRGSIALVKSDGTYQVYFATATTIEQLQADYTFSSIDTGLSVTSGDDMSFVHFGSYLLNSNTTDGFQAYNIEAPAGNNAVSGAPAARFIFVCNNVVFALDCDGNNRRMQTSGIGDHTAWSTTLGSDGKTFEDGGALVAGVDMKNGAALIFQHDAMRIVQFGDSSSGALYTIVKAADGRGSVGERSVVAFDGMCFYLATDGFYRFDLSNGNTAIGAEKINRTFLADVDASRLDEVQGAVDPLKKIVVWRYFSSSNSSTTVADRCICYDWDLNEWFTLTIDTAALTRLQTPGYTLDAMDAVFGTLDGMSQIPLDDRFYQGGQPVFAALNSSYIYAVFSGSPLAYTLQTYTTNKGFSALENEVTPICDNANAMISLGVQRKLDDTITWKTARPKARGGKVKLRGSGMSITFRETGSAGDSWTYASGIDYASEQRNGSL